MYGSVKKTLKLATYQVESLRISRHGALLSSVFTNALVKIFLMLLILLGPKFGTTLASQRFANSKNPTIKPCKEKNIKKMQSSCNHSMMNKKIELRKKTRKYEGEMMLCISCTCTMAGMQTKTLTHCPVSGH